MPQKVIRKLSRLAALFEDADEQFERVRKERAEYLSSVRKQSSKPKEFLDNDLNLDSFREYLLWKFKGVGLESRPEQVSAVFELLDREEYKKLSDLDNLIDQTAGIRDGALRRLRREFPKSSAAANQMGLSMFLAGKIDRDHPGIPRAWLALTV
jgi:hypothetical protein